MSTEPLPVNCPVSTPYGDGINWGRMEASSISGKAVEHEEGEPIYLIRYIKPREDAAATKIGRGHGFDYLAQHQLEIRHEKSR